MHRHFATVYSKITQFSQKCREAITVYESLHQSIKYSLINNGNGMLFDLLRLIKSTTFARRLSVSD